MNKSLLECLDHNKFLEQEYRNGLEKAVSQIRSLIPETIHPKSGCTEITGLLTYLIGSYSPATIVILSDGEETCASGPVTKVPVPAGTKVLLLLIPKAGPINVEGPRAFKRGDTWRAIAPGIMVLPYTAICAETLAAIK